MGPCPACPDGLRAFPVIAGLDGPAGLKGVGGTAKISLPAGEFVPAAVPVVMPCAEPVGDTAFAAPLFTRLTEPAPFAGLAALFAGMLRLAELTAPVAGPAEFTPVAEPVFMAGL